MKCRILSYLFKISNLTSLKKFKEFLKVLTLLSHPLQNYMMDVVPQLDLKFSYTRWSKSSEVRLQTSSDAEGRRVWTNILPLVHTNGSVKKLILFLLGHAILQSSRTKFWVAWLEIFRPGSRHCHTWGTSIIPLKTSQLCDEIQEDLQACISQININGSTTTAIKFQLKRNSRKWRRQLLWPTWPLGLIG
jgi:hypothetical protein